MDQLSCARKYRKQDEDRNNFMNLVICSMIYLITKFAIIQCLNDIPVEFMYRWSSLNGQRVIPWHDFLQRTGIELPYAKNSALGNFVKGFRFHLCKHIKFCK